MVREPHDENGRTNWGPRLLAPLAFFAAVTVLVLLVQSSLGADPNTTTLPSTPNATRSGNTGTTPIGNPGRRRNYRIREGDTLLAIAERFNTTVKNLTDLNPDIEPNNLEPGTRIRIQ